MSAQNGRTQWLYAITYLAMRQKERDCNLFSWCVAFGILMRVSQLLWCAHAGQPLIRFLVANFLIKTIATLNTGSFFLFISCARYGHKEPEQQNNRQRKWQKPNWNYLRGCGEHLISVFVQYLASLMRRTGKHGAFECEERLLGVIFSC